MAQKQRFVVALGLLVGAFFLWLALRDTNLSEIGAALSRVDPVWIAVFLVAVYLFYWLKAVRWRVLLTPVKLFRSGDLFPPVMVGYLANLILPAQLGELVRALVTARHLRLSNSAILASIVVERAFDFLTVLLLLGLALLAGAEASPFMVKAGYFVTAITLGLVIATAVFLAWTDTFVGLARRCTGFVPPNLQHKLLEGLEHAAHGMAVMKDPKLLAQSMLLSILQWGFQGACVWVSMLAVGIDVPFSAALLVTAFMVVSVTLPTSPGYVGSIQIAYTLALASYDVSASAAFAASIVYHVLAYVTIPPVGLYCLHRMGYSMRQARQDAVVAEN